jgi:DNA-binding Lrp family transcriptional regulator
MPFAYVLISVESGSEEQVVNELEKILHVKETYMVYGVYDLILKVEFDDRVELSRITIRKIRGIQGIESTMTLLIL